MSSPRITFQYGYFNKTGVNPRLLLEQKPVPSGKLALTDLANMLALVRSGISATTYIVDNCPATVAQGVVIVPLIVYVWPSEPNQSYGLTAALPAWTTIDKGVTIEQPRDFDLVIEETNAVDLPCLAAGLEITWQTPAITPHGVVIDPPEITGYDTALKQWTPISTSSGPINRLRFEREIFGVLRVRCLARGYQHTVTMRIPKTGDQKLTDIEETLTAAWLLIDGDTETTTLDLTLPGCVAALLEACEDDPSKTPGLRSEFDEEELIPELRYSTCDGLPIGVVRLTPVKKEP